MRKHLFLWLLAAMLSVVSTNANAQVVWDGTIGAGFESGTGTAANPYIISTGPQFGYFINSLHNGTTYSGKYIRLNTDIVVDPNAAVLSYPSTNSDFAGTFNGNNKHLSVGNIYYDGKSFIFYKVSGTIMNLVLRNYKSSYGGLCHELSSYGMIYGCFCEVSNSGGYAQDKYAFAYNNYGQIINCNATGTINGGSWDYGLGRENGGIVYNNYSTGTLLHCTSTITLYNGSGMPENNKLYYSNSGTVNDSESSWNVWKNNHTGMDFSTPYTTDRIVIFYDPMGLYTQTSKVVTDGNTIGTLPTPSSTCQFNGWYEGSSPVTSSYIVRKDVVLKPSWTQAISQQPTISNPTVVVNDPTHARYQWYRVNPSTVGVSSSTCPDWTSSNHGHSTTDTKNYTITATAGQILSFTYGVSSESGYDKLTIKIGTTTLVNGISGEQNGTKTYTFPSSGTYTLTVTYTKDGSNSSGQDCGWIKDIRLDSDFAVSGATTSTLNYNQISLDGDYYCLVSFTNSSTKLNSNAISIALPTAITLNSNSLALAVGESTSLTATLSPSNAINQGFAWSSSDASIATVDNNGLVTAVASGNAIIAVRTTTGGSLSATCQITVQEALTDIDALSNVIYATNPEVRAGSQAIIPIALKNEAAITAFSFDLKLPEGVTIATDNRGRNVITLDDSRKTESHTLSSNTLSDGTICVACLSLSNEPFDGNDGVVVYVTINVDENMTEGEYRILIENIEMVSPNNQKYNVEKVVSKLSVFSVILGDVNMDGNISIADAVGIINFVIRTNTSGLDERAADANNDGSVSIADAVFVVNEVVHSDAAPARRMPKYEKPLRAE